MYRLIIPLMVLAFTSCSFTDALSRNVVARAGDQELTVDWFAQTLANGAAPLRPDAMERWAWSWVQYSLFLQALADGETFVDSATVEEAMWPEVLFTRVAIFQENLAETQPRFDSVQFDSAYAAGDHRIIDHILIGVWPSDSQRERNEKRLRAEAVRARLADGGSWATEAQATTDAATRAAAGRLGMIERGQTLPEFEQAAFSLEPGELSEVTETLHGYHVIRRPTLAEVREEYYRWIGAVLSRRREAGFLQELMERRGVRVTDEALDILRDAAEGPLVVLAREPGKVIGTYEGGILTDVGFVRWLQVWSAEWHISVDDTTAEALMNLATIAIQNEILDLEAQAAGVEVPPEEHANIRRALESKLDRLRRVLRVDSAMARADGVQERRQVARDVLADYKTRTARNLREVVMVPPFLAAKLRSERPWSFSYAGLDKAMRRAVELRTAREYSER